MAIFEIRNLSFSYALTPEKEALKNISLDIERGDYLLVIGKSGSGKTTLLKQLKPQIRPYGNASGEILFNGRPLYGGASDAAKEAGKVGFVLQDAESQIATDKVWHELSFGLESLGCDKKKMRFKVCEMASYFGIQDWFYKDTAALSGGQKQLVSLASVMVMDPDVIILDEPTAQLDPIAAGDFLNMLRKLNTDLGITIIITEHRTEEVIKDAGKICLLDDGELVLYGEKERLLNGGALFCGTRADLTQLFPSGMRAYFKIQGMRAASGEGEKATEGRTVPVTVKEGRAWLSDLFGDSNEAEKEDKSERKQRETDRKESEKELSAAAELRDVWFRYGKDEEDALRGMNLKVPAGKLFCVLGGNAAGKSTMLKVLCGLLKPYRGRVLINGTDIKKQKGGAAGRLTAMLPQNVTGLFVKKTVREELLEMGREKPFTDEIIALCGLEDILDANPFDLSGGEQERAALSKVLLADTEIILLDEPTKGMDQGFKRKLGEIIKSLTEKGKTVIMVSHDTEFCAAYADFAALAFAGEIISQADGRTFFETCAFYTTQISRMSRKILPRAVTEEDLTEAARTYLNREKISSCHSEERQ